MNTTPPSSNDAGASGQWVSAASLPGCGTPGNARLDEVSLEALLARAEAFGERDVPRSALRMTRSTRFFDKADR
jgi:hypothetical protein